MDFIDITDLQPADLQPYELLPLEKLWQGTGKYIPHCGLYAPDRTRMYKYLRRFLQSAFDDI